MEIKPINLEEAKVIVHKLAFRWAHADLPSEDMVYIDFIRVINGLLIALAPPGPPLTSRRCVSIRPPLRQYFALGGG
jgi:hypothetical protein